LRQFVEQIVESFGEGLFEGFRQVGMVQDGGEEIG